VGSNDVIRLGFAMPMLAILAGCLATPPAALPTPPPIPAGWTTVEMNGLRVALPPDLPVLEGQEELLVSITPGAGEPNVFLMALAPGRIQDQPERPYSTEQLTRWILEQISTTRPDRHWREELRLPAGPAVMVRFHFDGEVGHFEAVEGTAYAISTAQGIAYLQMNMSESLMGEFGAAMAEVPLHLALAGTPD
jgi:hypothetical protein